MKYSITAFMTLVIFWGCFCLGFSQSNDGPVLLHEMTWVDVQAYLEANDMVIIPLGSTEQHGPHLPLGADYLGALEFSQRISEKTGVLVAPILMAGYSPYHSGFPGTLSISPETMEQVVFEAIESLIKHGFRKILFFNAHGGNNIIQEKLTYRINQTTKADAVSIGVGSPLWPTSGMDAYDWHAGKFETSLDLCLFPDLVQMENAEKPLINFSEETGRIKMLSEDHPELTRIWEGARIFVPEETGKGGAVHEMSSNGVVSFNDPNDASVAYGEPFVEGLLDKAVALIEAWKQANSESR